MHSVNSRKTIKASVSPVKNDDENHSQDIADLHSQMKKDGREWPLNLVGVLKTEELWLLSTE